MKSYFELPDRLMRPVSPVVEDYAICFIEMQLDYMEQLIKDEERPSSTIIKMRDDFTKALQKLKT